MGNTWKYIVACGLLIGMGWVIYTGRQNTIPHEQQLQMVETKLIQQSPDIAKKIAEINAEIQFTVSDGKLATGTLATTEIKEDSATITVDVSQVLSTHDRLEPVLGHEIYHVWECYYIYGGATKFIALVNSEKPNRDWADRSFEKSAIARENQLRVWLKTNFPAEYRTMRPSRELQNTR